MARLTFYSFDRLLSFNARYNGVVGGRGLGKTFGAKKRCVKDAIKYGHFTENGELVARRQFILLRRYKEEVASAKDGFLSDFHQEFPDYDLIIFGNKAKMTEKLERKPDESDAEFDKRMKKRKWITIGYFVALSTAQQKKGVSYHNVYTIIFDEFIIEKGNVQYLTNEVSKLNNFYSTVDRWNDRVRLFMLANSVGIDNPYFNEWDIRPDEESEFVVRGPNGFVVFHFPDSEKFKNEVFATAFGQFIKETSPEYADYAVNNQFVDNHGMLLGGKDYKATYLFSLETKNGVFSVWKSAAVREMSRELNYYVQKKRPRQELMFTLLPQKMNEDKVLMTYNDGPLSNLRGAFRRGRVLFDEPKTRNTFIAIFERK